jgi:hypothetical protein
LAAQQQLAHIELQMNRPNFATTGKETMPMMMIDESALDLSRFVRLPYPVKYWEQEKKCLADLLVGNADVTLDWSKAGSPPDILVVPAVRTFRVHSTTVDSLLLADDSSFTGEHWEPPTIGYSMIAENVILVTEPIMANPYVLRHEALHFLLWRLKLASLGHPKEYFGPCDYYFDPGK